MRVLAFPTLPWRENSELLLRGQRAFSKGRYYEAQILWEVDARATLGADRAVIEGLATVAGALVALDEQRLRTAERLLELGRTMLDSAPELLGEVDVGAVRAVAESSLTALRRDDPTIGGDAFFATPLSR